MDNAADKNAIAARRDRAGIPDPARKEVTVVPPGSLARPPTKMPCEPAVIVPLLAIPPPAVPLANTPTEELTTMPSPVDAASWPLLVMPPEKVETWRMWMSS